MSTNPTSQPQEQATTDHTSDTTATNPTPVPVPRWRMEVTYLDGRKPDMFTVEQLEEVDGLIEHGPDWRTINRIAITLARNPDGTLKDEAVNSDIDEHAATIGAVVLAMSVSESWPEEFTQLTAYEVVKFLANMNTDEAHDVAEKFLELCGGSPVWLTALRDWLQDGTPFDETLRLAKEDKQAFAKRFIDRGIAEGYLVPIAGDRIVSRKDYKPELHGLVVPH
jgi:hypothetical protein